ncbi:MAG: rhamnulokinase [Aggregatilineales bacterium]
MAVDIGAESGRALAVAFDGQRLRTEEVHRFPNVPARVRGTLHWDILRLWNDVQTGIGKAMARGTVDSIGLDTWAIDFGLLDQRGRLLGNPVHYRDARTDSLIEYVFERIPRAEVFAQTGIQILPFNTLYQLASLVKNQDPALGIAARFVTVPDLLYFWLTGVPVNEYTNATTTQCYNVRSGGWAVDLMDQLGIPTRIFPAVSAPGQLLGKTESGVPVTLTPHHDTACAVIGVPMRGEQAAYLSSGTWSLLGLELNAPVVNAEALAANVTNEGGYGGTIRLLKNIMGLWLIQEARRTWAASGQEYTYEQLAQLAEAAEPFAALIDPDDPLFLSPGDIPARIRDFCARTGQAPPESVGAIARCIFESLALKYRFVLDQLKALTGRTVETLHVVGGGAQNTLLCQMTANAIGIPVIAGPNEATALGNAVVQLIALGELGSVAEARTLIWESSALISYGPKESPGWGAAYGYNVPQKLDHKNEL